MTSDDPRKAREEIIAQLLSLPDSERGAAIQRLIEGFQSKISSDVLELQDASPFRSKELADQIFENTVQLSLIRNLRGR